MHGDPRGHEAASAQGTRGDGPGDLAAAVDAEEVAKRLASPAGARVALTTAIAKLRGAIGHLNRERPTG